MDWYQLIIFSVVVMTLFILGFMFGEWLHGLAPSIAEALGAAWDSFVSWVSHFGQGETIAVPPIEATGTQWPVIDVYPE